MIATGQTIGNYRIVSKIGTGGMGAVYLAEHPLIGKRVALKVIHRELAGNRDVVSRFFQEAQAVNKIGHEHIIEIHDFGVTPEGDHFYIMEYLEGRTLASILGKETAIDTMRALHITAQIASALAAAHNQGVIHRDLKPDNIMLISKLGDPDFVKVLDFGLAKMFGDGSMVKTAAGVLLGTPQYMSPEACESKRAIDHRTDIYALGILLFQMVTGVLPFDGESMGEVLVKQVTALPPAPRGLNPSIPPAVEQVILRCLSKSVDTRFQTMFELRDAALDPEAYLRNSPPILPARSIAPGQAGVDAKTVMAYAAANQRAQTAPIARSGFADPQALDPHQQKTIVMPDARPPQLQPPVAPQTKTMVIATPVGYSSRPPRRVWPIVLVAGLLLGLCGGGLALAMLGTTTPATTTSASAADATAKHVDDAAVAAVKTVAIDAATTATIAIDSSPEGADVLGGDGKLLGKTPLQVTLPLGTASLELKLDGYKDRTKEMSITGNTALRIELEKLPSEPVPEPHAGPGSGSGSAAPQHAHTQPPPSHRPPPPPHKPPPHHVDGLVKPGDI